MNATGPDLPSVQSAGDAEDKRTLSVAALAVFIVSFFLPFFVQNDPGFIGAIAGYVLSALFAVLSRGRMLSRVVLACLAVVALLGTVNYALFRHRASQDEQEMHSRLQSHP